MRNLEAAAKRGDRGAALLLACVLWACTSSPPATEGERAFRAASQQINSFDGSREAFGNSDEARELAARFSGLFRQLREIGFTGSQKGMVTQGRFLTYCRMDPDRVCVLVHVPLLRKFTEKAQRSLLDVAWQTASALLKDRPGTRLAVGLRGVLLYDGAATGRVGEEPKRTFGANSEKELHPFFEPPPPGQAEAVPAEVPPAADTAAALAPAPTDEPRFRQISPEQALLAYLARLRDPSPEVRQGALAGIRLFASGAAAAVPDVARVLSSDDSPLVRVDAARTLGRIGTPTARSALEGARQDRDPTVRDAVGAALGEIETGSREAGPRRTP